MRKPPVDTADAPDESGRRHDSEESVAKSRLSRRQTLGAVGSLTLSLTAGCLGVLPDDTRVAAEPKRPATTHRRPPGSFTTYSRTTASPSTNCITTPRTTISSSSTSPTRRTERSPTRRSGSSTSCTGMASSPKGIVRSPLHRSRRSVRGQVEGWGELPVGTARSRRRDRRNGRLERDRRYDGLSGRNGPPRGGVKRYRCPRPRVRHRIEHQRRPSDALT